MNHLNSIDNNTMQDSYSHPSMPAFPIIPSNVSFTMHENEEHWLRGARSKFVWFCAQLTRVVGYAWRLLETKAKYDAEKNWQESSHAPPPPSWPKIYANAHGKRNCRKVPRNRMSSLGLICVISSCNDSICWPQNDGFLGEICPEWNLRQTEIREFGFDLILDIRTNFILEPVKFLSTSTINKLKIYKSVQSKIKIKMQHIYYILVPRARRKQDDREERWTDSQADEGPGGRVQGAFSQGSRGPVEEERW